MSVRPITYSEEQRAVGAPFSDIMALLGLSQGVLYFLHVNKLPLKSNWFANPRNIPMFALFSFGGLLGGVVLGNLMYGDSELKRLKEIHQNEKEMLLDG